MASENKLKKRKIEEASYSDKLEIMLDVMQKVTKLESGIYFCHPEEK